MPMKKKGKAADISRTFLSIKRSLITKLPTPSLEKMARRLSMPQIHVMTALSKQTSLTMRDLATRSGVAMPSMSDMINRLEREKIVTRHRDNQDRRIVHVQLTAKGYKQVEQFHAAMGKTLEALFDFLRVKEQQKVLEGLQIMERLLNEEHVNQALQKIRNEA